MDFRAELVKQRLNLASSALTIAQELEAGRAHAPFQEKLTTLANSETTLPIRVGILAPSTEVAHALLADFLGPDYNVCKVVVPSRLGYSEVLLQERGFLLDAGDGAREFSDASAFIDALKATHALESQAEVDLEPLRVKLKGPAHLNGLCLLIPQSLDALNRKPALLSTLADQADWIFLAGTSTTQLDPRTRQTIQLVLDHVTGLQSVMLPDAAEIPAAQPAEWWKDWKVTLSLGLVKLGSDLLSKRLSLLTAPDSELRLYLVESRLLRQLDMALALMAEETAQVQRQLGNRLNLTREGLADRDGQPDLRKTADTIRTKFNDELDSLLKAAERDAKAALQADGETNRQLREASASVTVDDIDQVEGDVTIKLSLAPAASVRLTTAVLDLARQRLVTDLRQIAEGLECSVRDTKRALEVATGARPSISIELPDENALWATISSLARPEIRYRGEMPRATLGARFNAARQVIMGMMILGTILGGAVVLTGDQSGGQGLRTYLAAFMIPMLIIGFLWTYVSFRKRETLTLEKEAEKLQDGVLSELRRVLQDLHREQMTLLNGTLQKAQRAVQQQLEGTFEKIEKQRQRETEEARRRSTEQSRSMDQRIARMRQFAGQLTTLQSNLKAAEHIRAQWLAAWINRFNQGKV